MTETPLTRRTAPTRKVLIGLAALIIVVAGGVAVWTMTCPCNRTPGFMLLGDLQDHARDRLELRQRQSRSARFRFMPASSRTR